MIKRERRTEVQRDKGGGESDTVTKRNRKAGTQRQ